MRFISAFVVALCLADNCAWTADELTEQLLIAAETGDNAKVETPLLAAVTNNRTDTVRQLLDKGADVNGRGSDRKATPLYFAATAGHDFLVSALLSAGAATDAADIDGWTPLLRAARYNHASTLRILPDHGADVNHKTVSNYTALMSAARWGCTDAVRTLVAAGANVNAVGRDGRSALAWARESKVPAIIDVLVKAGAK
jgi:ankyrin repeat protein